MSRHLEKFSLKEPGWIVRTHEWDEQKITHHGNQFLLSNGYMGYRGTLEEFGADERVGVLIPGLYDRVGDAWREPVNAPNGLLTRIAVNGVAINPLKIRPIGHLQELDMRTAMHRRKTSFEIEGVSITIEAERFLSADQIHLMAMRYKVATKGSATVTLETGIDQNIWDLNGPHLTDFTVSKADSIFLAEAQTTENNHTLAVAEFTGLKTGSRILAKEENQGSLRRWTIAVEESAQIILEKYAAVHNSLDGKDALPGQSALNTVRSARETGYDALSAGHEAVWRDRWKRADLRIQGDSYGQHALRYSLYQLMAAAPFHSENLSIPARALSGQVYKGAVFWDTEIFMFPFFLSTFPEVARNLVRYRIHTLPGARKKAQEYGCEGAFYPWESQEGGYDACTLFNVVDVFTGRPMRTYFRDGQIHISADVAWAIWRYVQVTGDEDLLWDGGWEVMLEVARFYYSRAYRRSRDDAFVLVDVTGPDEFHERVTNNAYTNYLVQHVCGALLKAAKSLQAIDRGRFNDLCLQLGTDQDELDGLRQFSTGLHLPSPQPETGVIEQFDGYFKLEDCSLEVLKGRMLAPNEYLGGGNGLATTTQILKQADVVLLTHLLGDQFDRETREANWEYYEPRTEHGSSLSACAYALVATEIDKLDFAYQYFLKTATIDLTGKSRQFVGTLYIGGTHPAANGGAWKVAVEGFGGVRLSADGVHFNPCLPEAWRSLEFQVNWRGRRLFFSIHRQQAEVIADENNEGPVTLILEDGQQLLLQPGRFWKYA